MNAAAEINQELPIEHGEWVLITDRGQVVLKGEIHHSSRGEAFIINGGRPPHKPGSTGRVWCKRNALEADGFEREFFPSVLGMVWQWTGDGAEEYAR